LRRRANSVAISRWEGAAPSCASKPPPERRSPPRFKRERRSWRIPPCSTRRASLRRSWAVGTRAVCAPKSGPRRCWASDAGKFVSCRRGYCALRSAPRMRKAKIICTMGPASREEPTLSRLVEAGMDVARLNFSHGTHEDHARAIVAVRKAAENAGRPVALLLDLQGPKIRVGKIEGGKVRLEAGAETIITVDPAILGTAQRFSCSYEGLPEDLSIGDPVLINDGSIRLEVVAVDGKDVRCRVEGGGVLPGHKGINLPGTPVSIPAMTPKDIEDLKFGLEHEIDSVAMSFVRSADDIRLLKRYA